MKMTPEEIAAARRLRSGHMPGGLKRSLISSRTSRRRKATADCRNSVPPILARVVAGTLIKAMRLRPSAPQEIVELGDRKLLQMTLARASEYYGVSSTVIGKRDRNYSKERADERRAA